MAGWLVLRFFISNNLSRKFNMKNLSRRFTALKLSLVAMVGLVATTANAALPEWAATAAADLGGSVSDFATLVGPIVLSVAVALLGIKLFKRFTNKI